MTFALYMPTTPGEWLAWSVAVLTVLMGLFALLMPRRALDMVRLMARPRDPDAVGEGRASLGGFLFGVGLMPILFAQPFLYLALGAGWAGVALGRLIAVLVDRGFNRFHLVSLALDIALAAGPLLYVFGIVP